MTLGDIATIVFVILAALIAMPCMTLVYGVFAPRFAARAEVHVTRRPILTFLAGLFIGGFVLALAAALGQGNAVMKFLSAVIALGGGLAALAGMSGIAATIGHALPSPVDRDRPWRALVRGSVVLELACLFPGIGWLLVYPVALVTGLGAAALSLLPSGAPRASVQPGAPIPTAMPVFAMAGPEEVVHR